MNDLPTKCHLCGADAVAVFYFSQGCFCDKTTVQPLCIHHAHKSGSSSGSMELIKDLTDGHFKDLWEEKMGVYSTMDITRADAIDAIRVELDKVDNLSDEHLEEMMFTLFGPEMLNNFRIVDKYTNNDQHHEWGYPDE